MSDWSTIAVKTVVKEQIQSEVSKMKESNAKYTLGDWLRDAAEVIKAVNTKPQVSGETKESIPLLSPMRKNLLDGLTKQDIQYLLNNPSLRTLIKEELGEREAEQKQKIRDDLEL